MTFVVILVLALTVAAALTAAGSPWRGHERGRGRRGYPAAVPMPFAGSRAAGFAAGRRVEPAGPISRGRPPGRAADRQQGPSGSAFAGPSRDTPLAPQAEQRAETLAILDRMSTLLPGDNLREALRATVIQSHIRYARHIAALYSTHGEPEDVTHAKAHNSLARAVDDYDPESGIDFLAYATPMILREVRALRDQRPSRHVADALPGSADRLTRRLGRRPTIAEIAADLGVRGEEIIESLDTALGKRAVRLADPIRENTDDILDTKDELNREQIKILLAPLSERNKRIVMMRYLHGMTDAQIGAELNISPVHVHRLLSRATSAAPFSA